MLLMPGSLWAQRISIADYIQKHKETAVYYMEKHGVPASVILGIAIHESAHGNSKIARYLNNHFGIKGPNNSTVIQSAYKGYESVSESYADFIDLIRGRQAFQKLFDSPQSNDYRFWVRGIARAGYAASQLWPAQVTAIIQKYNLSQWDNNSNDSHTDGAEANHVYRVQKGDTLYEIAQRFDTTIQALRTKNKLKSSNLKIGQQLLL